MNPAGNGGLRRVPLAVPPLARHAVHVDPNARGSIRSSHMKSLGAYLCDVIVANERERNFRIVCPDELESNRLGDVLEVTTRQYAWPTPPGTEKTSRDGRVLEILSEHMCQGWLQGYLLTGRHGLFPCYEAFLPDRRRHDEPVREVPEGRERNSVENARRVPQLPADVGGVAPGPQRLLAPGPRLHQQPADEEGEDLPDLPAARRELAAVDDGPLPRGRRTTSTS